MKLKELIERLQTIEKSKPGAEVKFQFASVTGNQICTRTQHLLDVEDAPEGGISCRITLGDYERDGEIYRDNVKTLQEQERR